MGGDYIKLSTSSDDPESSPFSFNDFPPRSGGAFRFNSKPDVYKSERTRTLKVALIGGSLLATILLLFAAALGTTTTDAVSRQIGSYASASLGAWKSPYGSSREVPDNEGLLDPHYKLDEASGFLYPPDVYPAALNPFKRASAAFVVLARNQELVSMKESIRSVEEHFNRKFGYPWVFMNDEAFTEDFKKGVLSMTRSACTFHQIPQADWDYPSWVNLTLAAEERQKMENERVIYGGSESYRKMCRFNSGFFFKQSVLQQFDYYWRVEPGVKFSCDLDYDPFLFMEANKKVYSFTIAMYEYGRTIESLWSRVQDFAKIHPEYIDPNNAIDFIVDDGKGLEGSFNLCHFWSNFEIADLRFWRSQAYQDFFAHLDETGNFFYERWGDAPVHSIAAALFLPKDQIHFWNDISYFHAPYTHCPQSRAKYFDNGRCNCKPEDSFDDDGYSCLQQWWRVGKRVERS